MVNVLEGAGGLLDSLRNMSGFRRSKNLTAMKAANAARIAKGRPGFAKPINLNPPQISKRARAMNDTIRIGGTQMLQSLLDTTPYNQEGMILLIQQKVTGELLSGIEDKTKDIKVPTLGSNVDENA